MSLPIKRMLKVSSGFCHENLTKTRDLKSRATVCCNKKCTLRINERVDNKM